jgi:hypothetical protein
MKTIVGYLHCAQCIRRKRKPNVEVGVTPHGIQVWCRNCDLEVAHLSVGDIEDLMARAREGHVCDECEAKAKGN